MNATGYEKRIALAAPHLSRSKCQRLALKLAKRADRMQTVEDFYRALRVLGVSPDPTALAAVENMEAVA